MKGPRKEEIQKLKEIDKIMKIICNKIYENDVSIKNKKCKKYKEIRNKDDFINVSEWKKCQLQIE